MLHFSHPIIEDARAALGELVDRVTPRPQTPVPPPPPGPLTAGMRTVLDTVEQVPERLLGVLDDASSWLERVTEAATTAASADSASPAPSAATASAAASSTPAAATPTEERRAAGEASERTSGAERPLSEDAQRLRDLTTIERLEQQGVLSPEAARAARSRLIPLQ